MPSFVLFVCFNCHELPFLQFKFRRFCVLNVLHVCCRCKTTGNRKLVVVIGCGFCPQWLSVVSFVSMVTTTGTSAFNALIVHKLPKKIVNINTGMDRAVSARAAAAPEPDNPADSLIVFDGSSPAEVSHARQLWRSMILLPPLESRLLAAEIRQRLPVSRPQRPAPKPGTAEPPAAPALRQRREERQRFAAMAERRREILALLRRQREQRIQRELISAAFKPGRRPEKEVLKAADCDQDKELVRQLQWPDVPHKYIHERKKTLQDRV